MVPLLDIRYVRLATRDLVGADRFAREVIGLQRVRQEAGANYYRSDGRDHTLVYTEGDPCDQAVAFELRDADALRAAADELVDAGVMVERLTADAAEQRRVHEALRFADPSGNRIELVVRPQASGRRYFPSRDAGITGFSHIGLCTTDARRDEAFWTGRLSARVSDRIGEAALLRIDPVHHRIALFPTTHAGVQHINHQVESIDDVMRAWYHLRSLGVRIVFGPGRHPTSGATFVYFEGPDGMVFEYSSGVRHIAPQDDASWQPRQFPPVPESFCMWGSKPDIAEFMAKGAA